MRTFIAPLLTSSSKPVPTPDNDVICWLDFLLQNDLSRPRDPGTEEQSRPLTVLITGPPGAGKSLLVQQLCYNVARNYCTSSHHRSEKLSKREAKSLLITTEATPESIVNNMIKLGMVQDYSSDRSTYIVNTFRDNVLGNYHSDRPKINNPDGASAPCPLMLVTEHRALGTAENSSEELSESITRSYLTAIDQFDSEDRLPPQLVVVDSLNVFSAGGLPALVDSILACLQPPPPYLFLVLDSTTTNTPHFRQDFWSFLADVCLRVEYGYGEDNYFHRYLEIVKTRHQYHVLGRHVMKIFPNPPQSNSSGSLALQDMESARPKLTSGGVFVFPSVHSLLSVVRSGRKLVTEGNQTFRPQLKWKAAKSAQGKCAAWGPGDIALQMDKSVKGAVSWSRYEITNKVRAELEGELSKHYGGAELKKYLDLIDEFVGKRFTTLTLLEETLESKARQTKDFKSNANSNQWKDVKDKILQSALRWETDSHPTATLNWPVPWCFELVGGGVPLNKCTALIGRRGARKSYFGYQFLLDGICNGETTMVVSFRDDPASVQDALLHIAQAKQYKPYREGKKIPRDKLIIIYQRPGYVTPDEFMHRIVAAVGEYAPSRVLVNAVDQWESAYPLLAKCEILLPALVDFLGAHEVTSMIIGVDEGDRHNHHGLASQSEVVLSFEYQRMLWPPCKQKRRSRGPSIDGYPTGVPLETYRPSKKLEQRQPKVVVRAVRVPRAAAGSGLAILEFDPASTTVAGLTLRPLAPEYPESIG